MSSTSAPPHLGPSALSGDAQRLLDYLQRWCDCPQQAKTDCDLARQLTIPERQIIDLARELLAAGHLVLASCGEPPGRYVVQDLAKAREYYESLHRRLRSIGHRAVLLKRAIRAAEARRLIESTGQRRFKFTAESAEVAERKR